MKKLFSIVTILICLAVFAGCEGEKPQAYFTAQVSEVNGSRVLVEVIEPGNSGISQGERFYIFPKEIKLGAGDKIKVCFDGMVMETYPLQLGEIYSITKIG